MTEAAKQDGKAAKPSRAVLWLTLVSGVALATLLAVPAVFVLVCIGMMPSMIAVFIDPDRSLRSLPTMVSLNLAGVVPVVVLLWQQGHQLSDVTLLLKDVFVWGLMYGGVLLALFLLWIAPVTAHALGESVARHNRWRLERARGRMIKEWGEGLAEDAAPKKAE